MTQKFDVAIVGGGIVGLAHAWSAARRGLQVLLLERDPQAQGATVRNFGMIWPIGQPAGPMLDVALRARAAWCELAEHGALEVEACGSLHLAYRQDEWDVLQEFHQQGTHQVELVAAEEVRRRAPFVQPEKLIGGLWSDTELRVDPRTAAANIRAWLVREWGISCKFGTAVSQVIGDQVVASNGEKWQADRIVVCSNTDFQTLFPDVLHASGLRRCKLQMLQAQNEVAAPHPAPHIASGLTLRHYTSFEDCPSLPRLRQRIASETPELDRFGIHVMASCFPSGRVILGDSHEYDDQITPFDDPSIDELILRELRTLLDMRQWRVTARWHGLYAKHSQLPVFRQSIGDHVEIFAGTGGAGMTLAFGLAQQAWDLWHPSS